nr:MAG TPA: hypothetical protein [Caudoviricetes sp.]DAU42841.1 MAG TPA: hypothetical protein [Caudoviricetes sp.]
MHNGRNLKFLHTKDLKASLMTNLYLGFVKTKKK